MAMGSRRRGNDRLEITCGFTIFEYSNLGLKGAVAAQYMDASRLLSMDNPHPVGWGRGSSTPALCMEGFMEQWELRKTSSLLWSIQLYANGLQGDSTSAFHLPVPPYAPALLLHLLVPFPITPPENKTLGPCFKLLTANGDA